MTKNKYILVRHGQTYWNKNGIMHGQYDIPLNEIGIKQAYVVSDDLKHEHFDYCYCSPLQRAKATANKILRNHRHTKMVFDARLMELNKGLLEGKHLNSEKLLKGENSNFLRKYKVESKVAFLDRVKSFVNDIESKHSGKQILIVAHSGTIKMFMFALDPPKKAIHKAYYDLHIKNCKPYTIESSASKGNNMKIGFFPMVADILHSGHVLALEEAKKHCDLLIVGLHCKPTYKNPIQSIYERYMQLRAVKWVDEVIPYEDSTRDANMFASLEYDVYFLGEDHRTDDWEMKSSIEALGKEIVYLKRKHNYSSTRIKNGNT
jgi:glycerol-3-phosphate cytidylyltransferase